MSGSIKIIIIKKPLHKANDHLIMSTYTSLSSAGNFDVSIFERIEEAAFSRIEFMYIKIHIYDIYNNLISVSSWVLFIAKINADKINSHFKKSNQKITIGLVILYIISIIRPRYHR